MRRIERKKDEEWALNLIDRSTYMVLSMVQADGTPYCVPLSPVRWGRYIYFHCAQAGRKLEAMRSQPHVCMAFVGDTQVPPGQFTTYYASAVAFGEASEVEEEGEQVEALRRLCLKYCPEDMAGFDAAVRGSLPRTGIWKVGLGQITGKSNFPAEEK